MLWLGSFILFLILAFVVFSRNLTSLSSVNANSRGNKAQKRLILMVVLYD